MRYEVEIRPKDGGGCGKAVIGVFLLAMAGIAAITGGGDDNKNNQPATSTPTKKERVQKSSRDITPAKEQPLNFSIKELPKSTPAQLSAEESACDIWRKAQPALAARLQPGEKCYR